MERNRRAMWLSKPSRTEIMDGEYGTGEYVNGWSDPVEVRVNASAPSGDSSSSPFGTQVAYDRSWWPSRTAGASTRATACG